MSQTSPTLLISPSSNFVDVLSNADLDFSGIKYLCFCVFVNVYAFVYLLHTTYQNTYSTREEHIVLEMRTFWLVLTISKDCLMVKTIIIWDSSRWTSWKKEEMWQDNTRMAKIFIIVCLLRSKLCDSSFCPHLSCFHVYSRHCGCNFNLKNTRGNPSPHCSLMDHRGTGVCREWLNSARRPGTIKSRLLLCNRPFPSHNVTSGKTWRSWNVGVCEFGRRH